MTSPSCKLVVVLGKLDAALETRAHFGYILGKAAQRFKLDTAEQFRLVRAGCVPSDSA